MRLKLPNPEGELAYTPWNVANLCSEPLRVDWVVLIWEVAGRCDSEELDLDHLPCIGTGLCRALSPTGLLAPHVPIVPSTTCATKSEVLLLGTFALRGIHRSKGSLGP